MKLLTNKKIKTILNLLVANQIIFNGYDNLTNEQKVESFDYFCSNTARAISELGGLEALEEAKGYIFYD